MLFAKKPTPFSETALFRVLATLEMLISLAEEAVEGYQVTSAFAHPFNLKLLIQISLSSSSQN